MRCYRCGQEIPNGVSVCVNCHSDLSRRSAAKSPAGRAMRTLYDRYGCKEVLIDPAYLTNGLGDLLEDSKNLRNRVRMGMEAGLGKLYFAQLPAGATNPAFYARARKILVEDAGLNENSAGELIGYFDEMVGWPAGATTAAPGAQAAAPGASPRPTQAVGVQTRQTEAPGGKNSAFNNMAGADVFQAVFGAFPKEAVPVPSGKPSMILFIISAVLIASGIFAGASGGGIPALVSCFVFGIACFVIGLVLLGGRYAGKKYLLSSSIIRNGATITVSWTPKAEYADKTWYVACDGRWISTGLKSPVSFTEAVPSRRVVLAFRGADGKLNCAVLKVV